MTPHHATDEQQSPRQFAPRQLTVYLDELKRHLTLCFSLQLSAPSATSRSKASSGRASLNTSACRMGHGQLDPT
jgi:hypothetical protein